MKSKALVKSMPLVKSMALAKSTALVFAIFALGLAATAPARADYAVVQWSDGYCHIWWDASGTPWGTNWTKIAVMPDWETAVRTKEMAEGSGQCR